MRLHFAPDLNGPVWAGPPPEASFGEAWVGPRGLLDHLETALGLGGAWESEALRAAALVPAVRRLEGFWSASAEVDPLAVAQTLLRWRDELSLQGWDGQPLTPPRLTQLAALAREAAPGLPDRLAAVAAALDRRPSGVGLELVSIRLVEPVGRLPQRWQRVLQALSGHGVRIAEEPVPGAPATGDLGAARSASFTPARDGSLALVRPPAPLQAAEEVAAWLSVQEDLTETLVIGADAVLDQALRRHGLPTTGSPDPYDNSLLQLLPLVLALGWDPPDPARALELLLLPVSPVPAPIGRQLAQSLHVWPAVDSDRWRTQLAEGLEAIGNPPERKARVAARLDLLLTPRAKGETFATAEAERRVNGLTAWMGSRRLRETTSTEAWDAALAQCLAFMRLLEAAALPELGRPLMHRLVEDATAAAPDLARHRREAGLWSVQQPGAVLGPVRRILWWSFDRESAPAVHRLPLAPAERAALAEAGCPLPDPGGEALALAERWQRPLAMTREQLVLACPELGATGESRNPHPLWDEIASRLADAQSVMNLRFRRPPGLRTPERVLRLPLPLPQPRRDWQVRPELVHARAAESPTSLASLVGCSLQWALKYLGKVYGGVTTALPEAERLLGSVVHELLSRVLRDPTARTPEEASQKAVELFDREGPRLAASLFWPGAEPHRAEARQVLRLATAELYRQIRAANLEVLLVETEVETTALGALLRGTPDVVLRPEAVVDLKWGGAGFRRDQLRSGTAYQLAAYAHLVRAPEQAYPAVAYFILKDQRLLTSSPSAFPAGETVSGPGPVTTWKALEAAHAAAWAESSQGRFSAPANPDGAGVANPPTDGIAADGQLRLAPPCRFCEYGALCGLTFYEGGDGRD